MSKNVSFSPMIRALARTFFDSRIIATVRNPVNAVGSHISSMMAGAAVFDNDIRGNEFRDQMIAVQRYAYTHILEILSGSHGSASGIVCMEDLQDNPASTIRGLYNQLGYRMAPGFEAYIDAQNQRQKQYKSGHHYDLVAWGLSAVIIYEQFLDIFDRFGYPEPEGAAQQKE